MFEQLDRRQSENEYANFQTAGLLIVQSSTTLKKKLRPLLNPWLVDP